MENKCQNCGGEGLIHQGDSIRYTCSNCAGTGKSTLSEVTSSYKNMEEEVIIPVKEEGFLEEASEESEISSEEVE